FFETGDLDVGLSLDNGRRYRLNLHRNMGRVGLVARAIPSGALNSEALMLPPAVEKFASAKRGLVLVTGSTGSGKSTTLAAAVHCVNQSRAAHIVTIEDPIEFVHRDARSRVTQREIGKDTLDYSQALREVVRQSPDVIVIGEIRDMETMKVALSAALTGHLVLATVHTVNSVQTIQRLLGYFPEHARTQAALDLSMCLVGIVSQRLLPKISGNGRVLAAEVLTMNPAVRKLIHEQRVDELYDILRDSRSSDLTSYTQALVRLYQAEHISHETALAYASHPEEFALQVRGVSTGSASFAKDLVTSTAGKLDLKTLLQEVSKRGASDLHITEGRAPILRIAGKLEPLSQTPLTEADMRTLLFSVLSTRQRSVYQLEREIDFALAISGDQRFRINAYFQKGRMAASLRAISSEIPSGKDLGLPQSLLRLGQKPQGLLLVVGPTGSGKTTTLACLLNQINERRNCRIVTIEDPIEYTHESKKATIDQREVNSDTQSFSAALKYVLRQDPDVILVGEMRDLESVSAALTAAETGHLVMATLHTNSAVQAIERIVDVFPARQQNQARAQLSSSLLGVVSQRLLPVKNGEGRLAAFEVLVATPAVRTIIRENKPHQAASIMESSRGHGMVTMDRALKDLYEAGKIHYEDVLRYVSNPKNVPPTEADLQIANSY
ncbi:MAG: PilT/PilU family type 4a pilus ATPase, partial [Deltaproteobacteria bacterium]|nr:PilT/PilU family type 4a pilus ATPase [Deltaproteobacteria bacterium]